MPSLQRSLFLIWLFFSAWSLFVSLPCFAAEQYEFASSAKVNASAAIRNSAQLHSNFKDENNFVEKLSPFRNCTGNPFYMGQKSGNPNTARPERQVSSWAKPSTAGNGAPTLREKLAGIVSPPEPLVIHRYPEERKNSRDQVTEQPADFYNCTGNPFFNASNTMTAEPSRPARITSIAPQTIREDLSSKQPSHNAGQGLVIVLDPGHGGNDPGAVSRDGLIKEKDLTLDIANRVKVRIEETLPDCTVILTRYKDIFLGLEDRTFLANYMKADLFISIHCNASPETDAEGIETYFLNRSDSQKSTLAAARENGIPLAEVTDLDNRLSGRIDSRNTAESMKLATTIHDGVIQKLGQTAGLGRNRGIKAAPLHVLFDAKMPAIMVECGFISNDSDKNKLASSEYRDLIARGVAGGSISYLKSDQKGIGPAIATSMWNRLRNMWSWCPSWSD